MHWSGVSCLYLIGCAYTSQKVVIAWPSSRLSHSGCSDLNSMIHVDILFSAPSLRRRILDLWSGNLLNKSQNDSNYTEIIHVEVQVKNGLHLLFHVYFFYEMIQECRNKLWFPEYTRVLSDLWWGGRKWGNYVFLMPSGIPRLLRPLSLSCPYNMA